MDLPVTWKHGTWYVGDHVGLVAMCLQLIEPKVANWVHTVEVLARIVVKYPQSAYATLTMLL